MGHKCKVRGRRTRPVSSPASPPPLQEPHLLLQSVPPPQPAGGVEPPVRPVPHTTVTAGAQAQAGVGGGLGHRGAGQGDAQVCQEGAAPAAEGRRGAEPGRGCALPPPVHLHLLPLPTPVPWLLTVRTSPYAPTPQALSRPWSRGWARRTMRRWARSRSARSTLSRSSATETTRSSPPPASDKGPSMVRGERARGSEACAVRNMSMCLCDLITTTTRCGTLVELCDVHPYK